MNGRFRSLLFSSFSTSGDDQQSICLQQTGTRNVKSFCSRGGQNPNSLVDMFLISRSQVLMYAYPPILLLLRALRKIKKDKAVIILVVPTWLIQCWFPALLCFSTYPLIQLFLLLDFLTQNMGIVNNPDPSQPNHMVFGWMSELEKICSSEEQTILINSRKDSARKEYNTKSGRDLWLSVNLCFWSPKYVVSFRQISFRQRPWGTHTAVLGTSECY